MAGQIRRKVREHNPCSAYDAIDIELCESAAFWIRNQLPPDDDSSSGLAGPWPEEAPEQGATFKHGRPVPNPLVVG
jgi:hypothetical protein